MIRVEAQTVDESITWLVTFFFAANFWPSVIITMRASGSKKHNEHDPTGNQNRQREKACSFC